jgi:hypothetical protein
MEGSGDKRVWFNMSTVETRLKQDTETGNKAVYQRQAILSLPENEISALT